MWYRNMKVSMPSTSEYSVVHAASLGMSTAMSSSSLLEDDVLAEISGGKKLTQMKLSVALNELKTAATANGKMITTRELEQQLAPTVSMLLAKYPRRGDKFREAFVEARKEVLDQLIEHKLVLSSLEEKNLQIPEYLVKQDVERFIRINFS